MVLEEFGLSSDFASDEHAAAYYRQVLHTSLLAGARGWLAWNNCDYDDLRDEDPYRHHVFELHFGLTDRPVGRSRSSRRWRSSPGSCGRWMRDGWERVAGDAALVVPEHFERVLPFTDDRYRQDLRADLLQAYVAAREADLPVELVRERDGLPATARLYLVPSAKLLTAPGLGRLRALAEQGATVYASYFAGSTANQRGPWLAWLRRDLRRPPPAALRAGRPDRGRRGDLRVPSPFGELEVGEQLRFRVAGTPSARAFLPVEPVGAEVVAVDQHGRPALLRHRLGEGQVILCTYPLEHMAAHTPWANPEDTWRLYSALADVAGVARRVRVDDPRVLVGRLLSGAGEVALFVNCSADTVVAEPRIADGAVLRAALGAGRQRRRRRVVDARAVRRGRAPPRADGHRRPDLRLVPAAREGDAAT